ncbi:MAG: methylenetetrahydrofolate reductase C-terminal domain-containing protein [Chloroflexi bacterium]|nr:methylenetetrahydrofolate reductase C-terminal domain-containing protein [Chloroflexota bacterium]
MIVAEQKPIAEIKDIVAPYSRLLVLGCGTCVKTCFAGGEDEVATMASALRLAFKKDGKSIKVEELTVERQCEDEFIQQAAPCVARNHAVLSLACGVGVQMVASRFTRIPVLPGVNTTFMGQLEKPGLFVERCLGCGDCILDDFAGICPMSRCSKKLLNGPCGGSQNGKCEVSPDIDCAWQTIIERFKAFGQMDRLTRYYPPRNWSRSYAGGPRKLVREDHMV